MPDKFEYGPIDTYEVIWTSGHVEHVQAHQVLMPKDEMFEGLFQALGGTRTASKPQPPAWTFHGEIDGRWRLVLHAPAEDIRSVRNVTHTQDRAEGVR